MSVTDFDISELSPEAYQAYQVGLASRIRLQQQVIGHAYTPPPSPKPQPIPKPSLTLKQPITTTQAFLSREHEFFRQTKWREQLAREYPASKYRIVWSPEAATIYEIPEPIKKPKETTITGKIVSGLEWVFGGGIQEAVWEKMGLTEPQKQKLRPVMGAVIGTEVPIKTIYGQPAKLRFGLKQIEEFAYAPVGAAQVVESFVAPVPTGVGAAVSSVFAGKPQFDPWLEKIEEHPGLFVGEVLGEYYTGKALLWVGGKAFAGLKKVTPQAIKTPVSQAVKFGWPAKAAHKLHLWRVEHLPTWRGSAIDVLLAKQSKWYYAKTGGLAVGEVAIPDITTGALSMGKLRAVSGAFEMTVAPRTGGVWIGKYLVEPTKKKIIPHMFISVSKGFAFKTTFQEYGFKRVPPEATLTPLVSQQQLTRMGIYPYIPRITVATGKKAMSMFALGLGTSALFRAKPVKVPEAVKPPERLKFPVWQPTFAYERIKYDPLKGLEITPEKREKKIVVPRLLEPQALVEGTDQKVEQISKTVQKGIVIPKTIQQQKQIVVPSFPTIPETTTTDFTVPSLLWRGGGGRPSRRRKDFFGAWFKRKRHIKTPEQMIKTYMEMKMPKIGGKRK